MATPAAPDSSPQPFAARHIGALNHDAAAMLSTVGFETMEQLVEAALPASIAQPRPLSLPPALDENQVIEALRSMAGKNQVKTQMIGQGFYGTHTPPVILRNVLENPAWYTAYTPYQPEISQGRLEALLNFQTMVADLTGLDMANASLLDESSAVAEAILLMRRANKKLSHAKIVADTDIFPQTREVITGRAQAVGLDLEFADLSQGLPDGELCGVVLQAPGDSGALVDHSAVIAEAKQRGALVAVAADLLALTLITPPGEQGADIAVGSTQRFGVPLFFGGPHAAYMAVKSGLQRQLPGRLVGVSKDAEGRPAYRLALQTREQHIRREKATSNICTAQALLAVVASMYGVYHGPDGLRRIAERVHGYTASLAAALKVRGRRLLSESFFDTLQVPLDLEIEADHVISAAEQLGINLRRVDETTVGISVDETTTVAHLGAVLAAFGLVSSSEHGEQLVNEQLAEARGYAFDASLVRSSEYMTHPIFHSVRSETQMMRYLRRLADRDLALDRTMIPLGSCTMKLNAAVEMEAISWPEFAAVHPYVPQEQSAGWRELIEDLEARLAEITGYAGVSIQPNAGSQGEYAGLLAIRQYHLSRGDAARDVCLIPASAHGTNAASAVLAGMQVVVVATDEDGTVDLQDLDAKLAQHPDRIAAIMITYPSTHGVFESDVRAVCSRIHEAGGQVYIDGANLNALVGLAQPGEFGGDVSHLNLHKTFCIPHGGGGPGVGPVAVAEHLIPFLPGQGTGEHAAPAITATRFGSAGVLPISWAYIALMGDRGLTDATAQALLSANYVSARLAEHFPTLYTGENGLVAHECILDLRELTKLSGITAEDVCKRLIDYGFHAPTLAFPVAGTLMVEPTESEDLAEIERFIEAMISIRAEIQQVVDGEFAAADSPLRHAPHPAVVVASDAWDRSYSREEGAFPVASLRQDKYFPPVSRIDGAHGDRNLMCSCPPPEAFADPA